MGCETTSVFFFFLLFFTTQPGREAPRTFLSVSFFFLFFLLFKQSHFLLLCNGKIATEPCCRDSLPTNKPTNNSERPLFLCAFKGTGKDTLYRSLLLRTGEKKIRESYVSVVFTARSDVQSFAWWEKFRQGCCESNTERFGFADQLKIDVHVLFKLPKTEADAYEHCKDTMLVKNEDLDWGKEAQTLRYYYRLYGKMKREEDLDYWIKIVQKKIEAHLSKDQQGLKVVVTDFRFANESQFFSNRHNQRKRKIDTVDTVGDEKKLSTAVTSVASVASVAIRPPVTARLFRSQVPVPDLRKNRNMDLIYSQAIC